MSIKRQSLWNMAPLLVVTAVGFFSAPLFYEYLGAERYAVWMDVQTFSAAFGFMDFGFGMAVGRYIGIALGKGDKEAVRSYWATGNAIALPLLGAISLVSVFVGVCFGPAFFKLAPASEHASMLRWSFVIGGLGLFLGYYSQFWNLLSQAHLDYRFLSILRTVISLVQILPGLLIAKLTANPVWIILWSTLISILQLGVFVWHSRVYYRLGFNFREAKMARLREMAGFTGKTFANLMVGSAFGFIDRLVLARLISQVDYANYCAGSNAATRLPSLSVAATGPVYFHTTHAVGANERSAGKIYDNMFVFMLDCYSFAAAWIVVWHPLVLDLWWGKRMTPDHILVAEALRPFFPILCVAFCLSAISNISKAQLGPLNRLGIELGFGIAQGIATGIGVCVGWYMGGLTGASYGLLISRVVSMGQDIYVAKLIGAGGWLSAANWGRMSIHAAVALVFFFVAKSLSLNRLTGLLVAGVHFAIIGSWLAYPYWCRWRQSRLAPAQPAEVEIR